MGTFFRKNLHEYPIRFSVLMYILHKILFIFPNISPFNKERTFLMRILAKFQSDSPLTAEKTRRELLLALDEAGRRRDEALRHFDLVSDDNMIVSAVHRLEAAAAQYSALLKQAKEMGIRRTFQEAEAMKKESPPQPEL